MPQRYFEIVSNTIACHLRRDSSGLSGSQRLRQDLGLCPLNLISIVLHLEAKLGIQLPVEEIESLSTVADLIAWVRRTSTQWWMARGGYWEQAPVSEAPRELRAVARERERHRRTPLGPSGRPRWLLGRAKSH